ncbi:hypothetical protein HanRHA438_Chr02g0065841 [Helianthus annuus]|nr:hypothetical protein HanRHA438_Chr02g0065841 [Helianthus annuus]
MKKNIIFLGKICILELRCFRQVIKIYFSKWDLKYIFRILESVHVKIPPSLGRKYTYKIIKKCEHDIVA